MTFGKYNGLLQGSVLILFLKNIIGSCTDRFVLTESKNIYSNMQKTYIDIHWKQLRVFFWRFHPSFILLLYKRFIWSVLEPRHLQWDHTDYNIEYCIGTSETLSILSKLSTHWETSYKSCTNLMHRNFYLNLVRSKVILNDMAKHG
jgi:hypothetical protein